MTDNHTPVSNTSKNSSVERRVFEAGRRIGHTDEGHGEDLPGKPDLVFRRSRLVVFVDGHLLRGFRYPSWSGTFSSFREERGEPIQRRDWRSFAKLRRRRWTVLRIREHEVERGDEKCLTKVVGVVGRGASPTHGNRRNA